MPETSIQKDLRSGVDGRWDYSYVAAAATTPLLQAAGWLGGIAVTETAAGAITIYDNYLYGDATTQITVTDVTPEGEDPDPTFRYTWNDTGTSPNWTATTVPAGTVITFASQNLSAGNNGTFTVIASGAKYVEVVNADGVAEADKATGTGTIRLGDAALTTVGVIKASIAEGLHLNKAVRTTNGLTVVTAGASKITIYYRD